MQDTAIIVVVIFLAAILMFIFPLMTMSDKKDDITTLSVQTATTEFVDTIRTTGQITQNEYENYVQTLAATGNSYKVEMTVQVLDENPAKKNTSRTQTIGGNVYITYYTSDILNSMNNTTPYTLKEGDIVSVSAENTNVTIGQQFRNFVYRVTGNSQATIAASAAGIVMADGNHN